jgi:hypothetical protein|tara:strand:- start:2624 stop:2770 length:147 start_codon:yes stop_codon:yes gene_type:complete
MEGGTTKVYTGPKNGKFYIKNGKKVYLDRKTIANNIPYKKNKKNKKNN